MDTGQEFRIYCSNITKSLDPNFQEKGKTQPLILEGVASTSDVDLEGDFITTQCIESFKAQATNCNIHNNHNVGLDDVIGTVLEVLDSDNKTLRIKFSILPLFRRHIEECIDNGVKLGLSIGGTILDYDNGDDGLKINNMMLHEISLTPLPANWNTMGTVVHAQKSMNGVIEAKCLNGVCKQFINKIEQTTEENMETEKRYYTKDEEAQFMSEDRVLELINEVLNNFTANTVTEERVNEIIDEKLKQFVEQAKALEKAEIEKAKKKAEEDEKDKLIEELKAKIEKLEKADKKEDGEEAPAEEEPAEEEPEKEEPPKKKRGRPKKQKKEEEAAEEEEPEEEKEKSLTSEELGKLIAEAVLIAQKNNDEKMDFHAELKSLKEDLQADINKAMTTTRENIEKSIFEDLIKSKPEPRADDGQIRKFLKTKSEEDKKDSSTMNVKDIAQELARD